MLWDRVWALGRGPTYIRVYPNPGFGVRWLNGWRLAFSVRRGFRKRRIE